MSPNPFNDWKGKSIVQANQNENRESITNINLHFIGDTTTRKNPVAG